MEKVEAMKRAIFVSKSYEILKGYMKKYTTLLGVQLWSSSKEIEELSNYILQTENLDLYNVAFGNMDYGFMVDCSFSLYDEIERLDIDITNDKDSNVFAYYSINAMCRTFITLTEWFVKSGKIKKEPQSEQANDKKATDTQSLNPKPQQEKPMKTRGRGRPKETLKDKMIDDAGGSKLQKMHTTIDGKKGKDVALIILACIKKGWLSKPTYTQVKNEFGDIGSSTGYNKYLCEQKFTKEELEGAINSLG